MKRGSGKKRLFGIIVLTAVAILFASALLPPTNKDDFKESLKKVNIEVDDNDIKTEIVWPTDPKSQLPTKSGDIPTDPVEKKKLEEELAEKLGAESLELTPDQDPEKPPLIKITDPTQTDDKEEIGEPVVGLPPPEDQDTNTGGAQPPQEPTIIEKIFKPEPLSLGMELLRTINYEDGTKDSDIITSFNLIEALVSGDFLAQTKSTKSLANSNINFVLIVNPSSDIKEGRYTIELHMNDKFQKEKTYTISAGQIPKRATDGKYHLALDEILPDQLVPKTQGVHKIKQKLSEMFFILNDNKRFYLPNATDIYDLELERRLDQSIIKGEDGKFIKIFDTDVPFVIDQDYYASGTFTYHGTSYSDIYNKKYYTSNIISPPKAVGAGKIIELGSGDTVVTWKEKPAGICKQFYQGGCRSGYRYYAGNTDIVVSTFLQRNESYLVIVNSPTPANFKIVVPNSDKQIRYGCGGVCNFPAS